MNTGMVAEGEVATDDEGGAMLIRLGFDIQFEIPSAVPMIALFHVHPTRVADLREPDEPRITPTVPVDEYED